MKQFCLLAASWLLMAHVLSQTTVTTEARTCTRLTVDLPDIWSNATPAALADDDANYAVEKKFYSNFKHSDWLFCYGFGFDIPPEAEIDKVFIKVIRFKKGKSIITDNRVNLVLGRMLYGAVMQSPVPWPQSDQAPEAACIYEEPGTGIRSNYDQSSYALKAEDINRPDFGVQVFANRDNTGAPTSLYYDLVQVWVQYTLPAATTAAAEKEALESTTARQPGGGVVLPDTDNDGVTDQFDKEVTTPGCPVDSRGVSRDTDGDGVPDCRDKELVTPTVCQPVDADGVGKCPCPEDCGPRISTDPALQSATLHNELHKQEALNRAQAEELRALREKLDALVTQVNNFTIALAKEDRRHSTLKAYSLPNPTHRYFTVHTQSGNNQPVSIRVFDALGQLIEERGGLPPNGNLILGDRYRPGSYLAEITQGTERAILRLVKQAN